MSDEPLDWDLQRRVALIPNPVWEAGPDAVAQEIAKMEEIIDLLHQVTELKAKLLDAETQSQTPAATLAHRSHNHPPEVVDTAAEVRREVLLALQALGEAERELTQPEPDPTILRRIGTALLKAGKAIPLYCAGLVHLGLTTVVATGWHTPPPSFSRITPPRLNLWESLWSKWRKTGLLPYFPPNLNAPFVLRA